MLGGEVEGDPDLPRVQVGLVGDGRDPLLLTAVQILESGDDLPDIRSGGQRCAAIMRGPRKTTPPWSSVSTPSTMSRRDDHHAGPSDNAQHEASLQVNPAIGMLPTGFEPAPPT